MLVQSHPDAVDYASRVCQSRLLRIEAQRTTDPVRRDQLAATSAHHAVQALALFSDLAGNLGARVQIDVIAHHLRRHPCVTDPTQALALAGLAMTTEATP